MFGFPYRLIDPEQFPFRASADALEAVAGYARQARGAGQGIIDNVTAVHQVWKNLDENIRTSAAPDLPARFGPIAHDGKDRGQALLDSADAMDLFVEDMSEHHDDLKKVTREARVLHDEVVHGVWIDAGNLRNPAVTTSGAASANPWDGSGAVMLIPGEQVQIPWYEHVPSVERNQALWTRHDAVAERIREAKQALNDRLVAITAGFDLKNGKIPSQARQTLRILADAGLDEVDEMTADKIGQAIADQMNAAAGGGKDADNHLLEAMLDWFGDDPAVMNAAFAALGEITTSELINNIGNRNQSKVERNFIEKYLETFFGGPGSRLEQPDPEPGPPPEDPGPGRYDITESREHGVVPPTAEDRATHLQMRLVQAALTEKFGWNHAAAYLDHYLDGSGKDAPVDPRAMLDDLYSLRSRVNKHLSEADDPDSFDTGWQDGDVAIEREGDSLDWYYAFNNFEYRISGSTDDYTLEIRKRYDWGIPSEGRTDLTFEQGGVALLRIEQPAVARLNSTGIARDYSIYGKANLSGEQ